MSTLGGMRDTANYYRELKFRDIRNRGSKAQLASSWLSNLITGHMWRTSIVAIDMSSIQLDRFGKSFGSQITGVHWRFLKSALVGHLNYAYSGQPVEVQHVFHDEDGHLMEDPWAAHDVIQGVKRRCSSVKFTREHIEFVNSDHFKEVRYPIASHGIQLCDIFVGATRYCIEGSARRPGGDSVAHTVLPLVRQMNDPMGFRMINGSYSEGRRFSLGFFPSPNSTFYRGVTLGIESTLTKELRRTTSLGPKWKI